MGKVGTEATLQEILGVLVEENIYLSSLKYNATGLCVVHMEERIYRRAYCKMV